MNRRTALSILAAAPAALAAPSDSFRFVHFTDTHIQPEMKAADGCRMCFGAISAERPDFALCGGDLVFDSNETPRPRAVELFDLYGETVKRLEMPVHSAPGNHDVVGLSAKSGIAATDPMYGKKTFEDRIGRRYSSFDHKGWHFILLDSIGTPPGGGYIGRIDDEQMTWLRADLEKTGTKKPIVMMTHIPVLSSVLQIVPDQWKVPSTYLVTNSTQLLALLAAYNVKAVLQGHTHIRETVIYNGCQYITSGAVCGNWWKGARLGHPEGFGVLTVRGQEIAWEYRTYGFQAQV